MRIISFHSPFSWEKRSSGSNGHRGAFLHFPDQLIAFPAFALLFLLFLFVRDYVLLEACIALADDPLRLRELARTFLNTHLL